MPNPFDTDTIPDDVSVTPDDLVGEGKKYKDLNELAKAYHHADSYIAQLKAEKAQADAEAKVLRDLVEARGKQPEAPKEPEARELNPPEPKTEVDFSELVRNELSTAKESERKANNINEAAERLNSHYGSAAKAQEAIRARAQQLGLGFDWLRDVAADSPKAFYEMMGVGARPSATPGYSNEFTPSSNGGTRKNFAYYEELRKTNPKTFYSAEVRKQMFDSARELGDKFYAP